MIAFEIGLHRRWRWWRSLAREVLANYSQIPTKSICGNDCPTRPLCSLCYLTKPPAVSPLNRISRRVCSTTQISVRLRHSHNTSIRALIESSITNVHEYFEIWLIWTNNYKEPSRPTIFSHCSVPPLETVIFLLTRPLSPSLGGKPTSAMIEWLISSSSPAVINWLIVPRVFPQSAHGRWTRCSQPILNRCSTGNARQ